MGVNQGGGLAGDAACRDSRRVTGLMRDARSASVVARSVDVPIVWPTRKSCPMHPDSARCSIPSKSPASLPFLRRGVLASLAMLAALQLAALTGAADAQQPAPVAPAPIAPDEDLPTPEEVSIARGGRLYDKFFYENNSPPPQTTHPAYPATGKQRGADTWRCQACHGWDYRGKDGLFGKGDHYTGIRGIRVAAGKEPAAIIAILRAPLHGYGPSILNAQDVKDLANFVSKGQIDFAPLLTADDAVRGNTIKGGAYYALLCVRCHGDDGRRAAYGRSIGKVAGSGAEMLHKLYNGQPGEDMGALRLVNPRIAADIASYLRSLPP